MLAYSRNEHSQFWSGTFYDGVLLEPFKKESLVEAKEQELVVVSEQEKDGQKAKRAKEITLDEKLFEGLTLD